MDNLSKDILQALHHYADGQATAEEIQAVDAWISGLDFGEALSPEIETELDKIYNRSHQRLMEVAGEENETRFSRLNRRPLLTYGKIAASVIGLIVLGAGAYWTLNFKTGQQTNMAVVAAADSIVPGGKKAMLQLSNGRIIELNTMSVGELAKEGNASIRKTENGLVSYHISQAVADKSAGDLQPMINTITIPVGGEYSLTLSDGTRVWMNAATTLRFPSEFTGNTREVELLQGEAFFDVAKNTSHPFHVAVTKSAAQGTMNIEVLGTSFNVSAYQTDDEIQTTLVSGAVKVSSESGQQSAILKPGSQASFTTDKQLEVAQVDTELVTAWRDGFFQYENTPLPKVLDELSRWYNIKVIYKGEPKSETTITGRFDRRSSLQETLESIRFIGIKLEYRLENRAIVIL